VLRRTELRQPTAVEQAYRRCDQAAKKSLPWLTADCYSSPQLYTLDPAWSAWSYLGLNFKSLVSSIFAKTIGRQAFVA
jgi:hypothetical protein